MKTNSFPLSGIFFQQEHVFRQYLIFSSSFPVLLLSATCLFRFHLRFTSVPTVSGLQDGQENIISKTSLMLVAEKVIRPDYPDS